MSNEYKYWNLEDQEVVKFLEDFPVKNQIDTEIFDCDLDLLYVSIKHFSLAINKNKFAKAYVEARKQKSWIHQDYADKVCIPYYFFKGYFHPWGSECLSGIRVGNPKDPMYKYSYETPSMRNYSITDAFNRGAIPCTKCFLDELLKIFQENPENL